MSTPLTQELARIASELSPEAMDALKRLGGALDEVIDDLAALERIAVYGRDREALAEHIANLHALRKLREEFDGSADASGPGSSQQTP